MDTIDEDYRQRQYAGGLPTKPTKDEARGIKNPKKTQRQPVSEKKGTPHTRLKGFDNTDRYHPSDVRYRRPRQFNTHNQKQVTRPRRRQHKTLILASKKSSVLKKPFAYTRSVTGGLIALSWTGIIWLYIQLPFAIITLTALGIDNYIQSSWVFDHAGKLISGFLDYLGMNYVNFQSLAILGITVVLSSGIVSLLGVGLQFKLSLLKPLGGRGAAAKNMALIASLIGYCIPGVNIIIPWVWIWIIVLMIYPK